MTKVHQYGIMSSPTTSQYAAIEAMRNGQKSVDAMCSEYNDRRKIIVDGFNKMGLTCFNPEGAFYIFPSIQSTGLTSNDFCEQLLMKEKVAVVPGTAFGECGEGFMRMNIACPTSVLEEAIERIKSVI
jgi:aminotransferase